MGKFNFGRKHISLLISGVVISGIVISSTVYAGYSKWVFKDTATYEHENTHYEVDPIRENATFYDGYDAVDEGTKYYDVYFMAQSIPDKKMLIDNGDGTHSFNPNFLSSPYYIDTNSADFGHFSGADCDATNYSFDIDKNYWFTRLENISEISVSAYDDVVKRIENNLIDYNNWNLQFLCWSLHPHEIYATDGDPWPTSFDKVEDGTATKVDGFYPYSEDFTPFYMNTSLDLYENNVKTINGRKTLFLYPVFSTGKNYFDFYRGNKGDQIKDLITVTKGYSDGTDDKIYYPYFNGTVTGLVKNSVVDVYSLDNFLITHDELKDDASPKLDSIKIKNDMNRKSTKEGWAGEGDFVHTVNDEQGNPLNLLNMSGDKNLQSGRYNIYIFVKHSTDHVWSGDVAPTNSRAFNDEINTINSVMEKSNRIRYSSLDGKVYSVTHGPLDHYADYCDYYVYFERIYEPRIIGGPTLDLNYDSELSKSLQFLRKGSSGNDNNRYQRRGVELQGDNWIEYPLSEGRTLLFKDYYFGVMLNPEVSFTFYGFDLVEDEDFTDTDYADNGFPSITYQDQEGHKKVEYYKSGAIFEKYVPNPDQDVLNSDVLIRDADGTIKTYDGTGSKSFVLIKPKNIDTTGKGIYNIVIDIKYDQNSNGHDPNLIVPTSVTFYGYKLSNLFINIMETDENGEVEMGHTQGGTRYKHFVNTDVYEYTRSNYYELANVTLDDVFTAMDDSTKTLREILTELKEDGKCLEDLVTSRYITLENLDPDNVNYIPFTIQKNYVFKIVSIPAELQ